MKPSTPSPPPVSADSLRSVREAAQPPHVAAPKRTSISPALEDAIADLTTRRHAALEAFKPAVGVIASPLEDYGKAWQRACRLSRVGDEGAANRPAIGGALDPVNSPLHPKHLKRALARLFRAAGIDVTDFATKLGTRKGRSRR